ncbi:MAG: hypothetical protein KDB88_02405 [Flavobacteriales bacterium]|nr:hypothetical protein [Flavobacteriales bacterium]
MLDGQELPYLKLRLVAGPHGIEVRHSEVGGILPTTIGIGIAVLICSGLGIAMILDNAYICGLGWLLIGSLLFTVGALLWRLSHRPVLFTVYAPERTLRYST